MENKLLFGFRVHPHCKRSAIRKTGSRFGMRHRGSGSSSCHSKEMLNPRIFHGQQIALNSLSLLAIMFISGKGGRSGHRSCLRLIITFIGSGKSCGHPMEASYSLLTQVMRPCLPIGSPFMGTSFADGTPRQVSYWKSLKCLSKYLFPHFRHRSLS